MGRKQGPRKGSMQFWPRKRSYDFLPRVNWKPVITQTLSSKISIASNTNSNKTNLLGFVGYKVGMASAFVKDNTPDSMTKNKRIIVPVTIIECPPMKILSVRFYKNKKVAKEVLNNNLDKEVKKIIKLPKAPVNAKELIEKIGKESDFEDVTILVYSDVKKTKLKRKPDLSELGLSGRIEDKISFIKENLGKEISITDVFTKGLVDIRGLTTGKGFQGTVKRFGVRLRNHKAEKGQRKVGSIGGWHPIGVRFTVPRPGQMGLHSRLVYNSLVITSKKANEGIPGLVGRIFDGYGRINSDYIILRGSVQGPIKRQLILTSSFRPTKKQVKKQFEILEMR